MGETRDTAFGAARPEDEFGLYFRRHLPAEGKGAGLVLPSCNSEAMALHLEEISLAVAPGAHAILLLDQADGMSRRGFPSQTTSRSCRLPPKSPELNPVENIWQFMRDNWLSNRVFKSYDDILDHCCFAWNKLIDMPWKNHVHRDQRLGSTGHDHQDLVLDGVVALLKNEGEKPAEPLLVSNTLTTTDSAYGDALLKKLAGRRGHARPGGLFQPLHPQRQG